MHYLVVRLRKPLCDRQSDRTIELKSHVLCHRIFETGGVDEKTLAEWSNSSWPLSEVWSCDIWSYCRGRFVLLVHCWYHLHRIGVFSIFRFSTNRYNTCHLSNDTRNILRPLTRDSCCGRFYTPSREGSGFCYKNRFIRVEIFKNEICDARCRSCWCPQ